MGVELSRTRKKLVATANRREGVLSRTGEPSVTFCEKEEQGSGRMAYFLSQTKNKPEQSELCSDVSKDYKKDIFSILADGVEPSHETRHLQRTRWTTPVNGIWRISEIKRGGRFQ